MAEIRMSVEEYLELLGGRSERIARPAREGSPRPPKRKLGKAPSGMARALKEANKRAKKKDGSFRKGWNKSKMMKYAHKIRRK